MHVTLGFRRASFEGDTSSFCTHVLPSDSKTGHADRIVRAAIAPNGVHLLTCSFDKTIILWDLRKGHGRPLKTFQGRQHRLLVQIGQVHLGGFQARLSTDDRIRP